MHAPLIRNCPSVLNCSQIEVVGRDPRPIPPGLLRRLPRMTDWEPSAVDAVASVEDVFDGEHLGQARPI